MKSVAAIAILKDGKMLMGKRKDNGKWTQPGGHLNEGEDPVTGALREVQEETGLTLTPSQISHLNTKIVTKHGGGGKIKVYGYKVALGGSTQTTMREDPDDEVHRWVWVNIFGKKNPEIFNNLHVPLKDNIIMQELGVSEEEKVAFIAGFEKKAYGFPSSIYNIRQSLGSHRKTFSDSFRQLYRKNLSAIKKQEF